MNMHAETTYDVALVGGGLAGLSAAILLQRAGWRVVLIEKETYPFHKVCGEYISMESWDFLENLGVPLAQMNLPRIQKLQLTAPGGRSFETPLPLGGFGISRFRLDASLASLAAAAGVAVLQGTKLTAIAGEGPYQLQCFSKEQFWLQARLCLSAYGKRSNVDVQLKRSFLHSQNKKLQNYVGVKYHVRLPWPEDLIGLHNFRDGYCGISRIEEDKVCLCYLTTAHNLRSHQNSIGQMEEKVVRQNPFLHRIFGAAEKLASFPVTISQVSFATKTAVEQGMLMLGDAAGMITPLCGNGMSIALHTGKLAAAAAHVYLAGNTSRTEMERQYQKEWDHHFAARLQRGRLLQQFFGAPWLSNAFVGLFQTFPFLARPVIRSTHGAPF